ncbi:hypothetical protein [Pseudobutyrivibrio sp. MD2005]|uniref:hypothetical protein n=1 Tax=Pseudobutyrivibrio sp. MD2005 TaxID=1410616 RepID=UPI00047F63A7|nr:hypothetical protein [Pseudobutyrivibrio sp. MD2005]
MSDIYLNKNLYKDENIIQTDLEEQEEPQDSVFDNPIMDTRQKSSNQTSSKQMFTSNMFQQEVPAHLNLSDKDYRTIQDIIEKDKYKDSDLDDEKWKLLKDFHRNRLNVQVPIYQEEYKHSSDFFKSKVKTSHVKYESLAKHQDKKKGEAKTYTISKKEKEFMKWMDKKEIDNEIDRIEQVEGADLLNNEALFGEVCVDDSDNMIAVKTALADYRSGKLNVKQASLYKRLKSKFTGQSRKEALRNRAAGELTEYGSVEFSGADADSIMNREYYSDADNTAVNLKRLVEACDSYIGIGKIKFSRKGRVRKRAISKLRDAANEELKSYSSKGSWAGIAPTVAAYTLGTVQNVVNTGVFAIQLVPWLIGKGINKFIKGKTHSPFTLVRPYTPKEWAMHYSILFEGPISSKTKNVKYGLDAFINSKQNRKISLPEMIFGPYYNTSSYINRYVNIKKQDIDSFDNNRGLVPN